MTTISSVQEFTCDVCGKRFDSRQSLRSHSSAHEQDEIKRHLPSVRTVALVGGITAGILIGSVVAWKIARRKSQAGY